MMPTGRILVHIVDDDPSVLDSLRALLTAHGFDVSPHASANGFLDTWRPADAACLLLDLRMPDMDGMTLLRTLERQGNRLPVIILTGHGDIPLAVQAIKAGALDFIEKPGTEEQILSAIRQAAEILADRPPPPMPQEEVDRRLARLTAREREVLDHLVLGETNKAIAERLRISQRTVEVHRARIREKLEARGLSDLIRMMRPA